MTEEPLFLRVDYAVESGKCQTILYDSQLHGSQLFDHPPLTKPKLRSDEELVVVPCKKRNVIILSELSSSYGTHTFLVAPCYSFPEGYTERDKDKIRQFRIKERFYLPGWSERSLSEGYVAFDQIQAVAKGSMTPRPITLTSDSSSVMMEWFRHYLTGTMDQDMAEIIRDVQSA